MNICEKILAASSETEHAKPGDIIEAKVDVAMINEITGPLAIQTFKKIGLNRVWDNQRIVLVLDHQVPADSVRSAELHKIMRAFAEEQNIPFLYDVGDGGVCHQVMVENGHVVPGALIVGADSHTCTYGALGAFATGIGSTEMAAVLMSGKLWFKVPESIKIEIDGLLQPMVTPKDVILKIVGMIGADGATYEAIEFCGSTVKAMSVSGRLTLCNMAVEMGAKTGIIEPDEKTIRYVKERTDKPFRIFSSDPDAKYERILDFNVDHLEPMVACPHSVDNVKPVKSVENIEIDQAFLGSCTNGRLEDLELAARIMRGRHVKKGVRMLVTPASSEVYLQALRNGILEVFIESGAMVCNPTCGACFGGHMGLLASGEVCVSSSNRNFIGRMGSPEAEIYLASPATVAASAVTGKITDPRRFLEAGA
jgi:3-isopropylmalate/(R)-2-methylmalate dehydratase large subunit